MRLMLKGSCSYCDMLSKHNKNKKTLFTFNFLDKLNCLCLGNEIYDFDFSAVNVFYFMYHFISMFSSTSLLTCPSIMLPPSI